MKLSLLVLTLTCCLGQQVLPKEVKWDYTDWQPILTPCPTCRQSRVFEAKPAQISTVAIGKSASSQSEDSSSVIQLKPDTSSVIQLQPVFQTNLPKIKSDTLVQSTQPLFKTNPSEIRPKHLVTTTPPRTPAISFPPTRNPEFLTSAISSGNGGNQVRLVFLPEGSIQQLSSANAAKIIPTSQAPKQILENIESIPPLLSSQLIQSIDFSDKQKRDHEGRIVSGGATNPLPMSLITTRGHENDAREKLKLLEAALSAPIEQENEKLPRVFIAPSHVPPPPGYVKIPLIPQGKPESQENGNDPLPPTFLTPDSRNPPPGFIKFDLPSTVSKLSKDIPVVVPNSQVEPNVILSGPSFSSTPGPIRPDASLNFQAQNVRTGKDIVTSAQSTQVIPKVESKPVSPHKSLASSVQAVTKPSPPPGIQNSLRPIPQRPVPIPQNNFQSQSFPPRQLPTIPQQSLPNVNQPNPFAHRPRQPPFNVFPGQPVIQPGQPIPQQGQFFSRPGQQFVHHNPNAPKPLNQFSKPNQVFSNQGIPRPFPPFSQSGNPLNQQFLHNGQSSFKHGQPLLQPGQGFPRIIQHFQQPNHPIPHPGQRPVNTNPNQSIFKSSTAPVKSDFPDINAHSLSRPEISNAEISKPVTPIPFASSSLSPIPPLVNTLQPIPKSVVQNTPRPQLISTFNQNQVPSSSPVPTNFFQSSPRPIVSTESPRFPPRPTSFSTPRAVSLIPQSPPNPFSPSPSLTTITPVPLSVDTQTVARTGFSVTDRPFSFTTPTPFSTPDRVSITTPKPAVTTTPEPVSLTTPRSAQFTTSRTASFITPEPVSFSTSRPAPFTTPRAVSFTTPRTPFVTTPRTPFITTPRPILTSAQPPFSLLNPQPVTFSPLQTFETSSPRSPFQQSFGLENTELNTLPSLPQEHQTLEIAEVKEPQTPFIQESEVKNVNPQDPVSPQIAPVEGPLTVRIPSFQRPQTTTFTRFPGPHSPRIPSFQRPSAPKVAENENSKEIIDTGRRQRLPLFPRFQKPRVTTILPEEEDQTLQPEITTTEFVPTTTPSSLSTHSQSTTVKVTTFKPKFNFNLGNRRPFFRRKQRPTEDDDKKEKDAGDKKSEPVTLFPPFSVARTLNPREDKKDAGKIPAAGEAGITVPPAGTFGRRIRPRTKSPSSRSNDESDGDSPRPSGLRARGPVGNRARELPDWLKARRRVRGRFRGPSTSTTESVRVVDTVLEDDIPLDSIDNNGFSGAESTLVVFSSPLENTVADAVVDEETEKILTEEGEKKYLEENQEEKQIKSDKEQIAEITDYSDGQSNIQLESSTSPEDSITSADGEVPQDAAESYEDYAYENTESLPEPEPEPSDKYVANYDKYEDDTEDTPETYNTHDHPRRQSPSFPNPQSTEQTVKHTSAHSLPLIIPKISHVENSKFNPVEILIDHSVEEVEDATERYVGNESSDESELLVLLPLDKETDEQNLDTQVNVKNEYESVAKKTYFSNENNTSEIDNETYHLGGEGEEGAEGEMDEKSQEHREDSYQEYNTESPEILSLFPNDHFTAFSPGQLQEYDYYEYDSYEDDSYEDEGITEDGDQNFGGSSAQVVFAVPVTEYYPEDTTFRKEHSESNEEYITINESDVPIPTTEEAFFMTTEELGMENGETTTEYPSLDEDDSVTESPTEYRDITPYYDIATEIPEEEVPLSTVDYSDPFVTTVTTSTPVSTTNASHPTTISVLINARTSTTTPRPASIRPLYARLQSIGKKEAEAVIKKLGRHPKILGQSTVTEIRSSEPIICFRDNQCVKARGQRRHHHFKP